MIRVHLVIACLVSIVLGSFAPAVSAGPNTTVVHRVAYAIDAFVLHTDGCYQSRIFISALQSISPPNGESGVIDIVRTDVCTDTVLFLGTSLLEGADVTIDKQLSSASVHFATTITDGITGVSVPIIVDLTWTATGELQSGQNGIHYNEDGILFNARDLIKYRDAHATGTVTDGSVSYLPAGSVMTGHIIFANGGSVLISMN